MKKILILILGLLGVLTVYTVIDLNQKFDLKEEFLGQFIKRLSLTGSPLMGAGYRSWNAGDYDHYYFAMPVMDDMARVPDETRTVVGIGSSHGNVQVSFAVLDTNKIQELGINECAALGNHLWKPQCPNEKCSFSNREEFEFDGRKYVRFETDITSLHYKAKQAYYQCSIGPETTLSVVGFFNKPYGAFQSPTDLKKSLSSILISKAAEDRWVRRVWKKLKGEKYPCCDR